MDAQDALASFSPSQIHAEAADFDSFGDQSNLRNPFADFRPLDAHNAADSAAVSDPPLPQSNLPSLFDPIAFNQPLPVSYFLRVSTFTRVLSLRHYSTSCSVLSHFQLISHLH